MKKGSNHCGWVPRDGVSSSVVGGVQAGVDLSIAGGSEGHSPDMSLIPLVSEHPLWARHCASHWGPQVNRTLMVPPHGAGWLSPRGFHLPSPLGESFLPSPGMPICPIPIP